VPVDGFELMSDDATASVLRNDLFDLTIFRRPVPGPRPAIGLTATWDGQRDPVVVAEVRERYGVDLVNGAALRAAAYPSPQKTVEPRSMATALLEAWR